MHDVCDHLVKNYTISLCIHCPQIQPNPVELDAIIRLVVKKESDYACSLLDASQPLLQQLAFHYCNL